MSFFRYLFLVYFLYLTHFSFSQTLFEKTIGGKKTEFIPFILESNNDSGHVIFGRTETKSFGNSDYLFIKVDSLGNVLWSKHYGTGKRDLSNSFIKFENNYLAAGWLSQDGTIDDVDFVLFDDNGNIVKQKTWGLGHDDEVQSIVKINGDRFVIVGESLSFDFTGTTDMYIATLDKNFDISPLTVYYSFEKQVPRKVLFTDDLNLFICGTIFNSYNYGFVMKTDTNSNTLWGYRFNGGASINLKGAAELEDGSFVVAGYISGSQSNGLDLVILKFSNTGNLIFSKRIGGPGDDMANRVILDKNNNLIIVGETTSFGNGGQDAFILKMSDAGDYLSGFTYGGASDENRPSIVANSKNNGFTMVLNTNSYGSGDGDFLLISTDSEGASCCSKPIENISVTDINVQLLPLGFQKGVSRFYEQNHFPEIADVDMDETLICTNLSLKIYGDTILCSGNIGNYFINPDIGYGFNWTVPEGASIISGEETSQISVQFGDSAGYVAVSVENDCQNEILDSVYVNISDSFSISLGSDTAFCTGNQLLLTPGSQFTSYLWQDGSTDSVYIANESGSYWVQVTDSSGCTSIDTVNVQTFPSFQFELGSDTTICYGDYVFLTAPDGYQSYLWQDGSILNSYIAYTAGIYWVEVGDTNNCISRDSMKLITNKVPDDILGNDTSFCKGASFVLRTLPVYAQYFWQDSSTDTTYKVNSPGNYWVTVSDTLGCTGSDTINLNYFAALTLKLESQGYLCEDDSVLLTAESNFQNYLWQDSSTNSYYLAKDSGTYWVRVSNLCETKSDTIVIDACSSIWVPNVFTPNNDGYNDYFYAVGKNIPKFKMEIFNRWGQTLKTLTSIDQKWDGTYHGKKCAQGTYFWVADYETMNRDGSMQHIRQQGSVMLMR